jgi:acyl carrier protein
MLETYRELFCETFEIEEEEAESATPDSIETWDSLHHMNLIAALEDEFDIELEPEDVVEITSFGKGIEVLKKHGVAF